MPLFQTVPSLFEYQVRQFPNRYALNFNEERLTYAQLNANANQLAHFLLKKSPESPFIPLFLEKSIDTIVSILAVLKAGLAYIPISSEATGPMMDAILLDSKAKIVLTHSKLISRSGKHPIDFISLDEVKQEIREHPQTNLTKKPLPNDLAYVIYTSGTTGFPKGVEVSHDNLIWTYYSWQKTYDLTETDIHLQMATPSFDVFVGDYLRAFGSGAELVLCPKEILLNPERLVAFIKKNQVNCAEFIPAILRHLMSYIKTKQISLDQFRLLVCGSDLWTMKEFRAAKALFGVSARLINSYGLTEATIDSTFFEENRKSLADNDPVPIGKPFPHVSVYVLDEQLNPLINTMGEIYIGGKGVAKGYLERPELTKERFIIHPQTEERLYKTGDFGKLLEDGTIEFLGRNQSYIKINGNRVELLALEAVLNQHPKIEFGIAYVLTKDDHYSELGCCIVNKEMKLKFEEVIAYIQHHLPHYYLPKRIYLINEPALTQNGKIDKSFVSQQIIGELKPYQIAPRDDLEEKILAIWTKEFPEHRIGVNQNFYALGGSSLVFATIITKLNYAFNVNLNFCNAPQTIEGLAQQIKIFCKTSLKQETSRFVKEEL